MNIYPILTISLLSQLTDRELQSNYLNHLVGVASPSENRTSEIADLLTQIKDPDLVLRIVNLALEEKSIYDPKIEIRESAITSILELGSIEVFPITLELAHNFELLATLILKLKEANRLKAGEKILDEFNRSSEFTINFLENAENL